ncbi:hypothetical protein EV645_0284 [Kribbella rubisoli]|uniref:Uncharacterized protein n=1 Tax=Kribbella rubisoli TaxID=3075929 RepID=A0A4Q7XLD1_9ACTN|nr:hypothetical protein [Kribbella rubisoli]RZU24324.1 hypothetical protein EV645_0284 [Kribbella rubisoli]
MSDPTTPADPTPAEEAVTTADAGADTAELAAVPATAEKPAGAESSAGADNPAGAVMTVGETAGDTKADGAAGQPRKKWWRRIKVRGPWVTVAAAVVVLLALALLGYIWGLGPLNRLNTERGITPPAKLAGLDRITDKTIRDQAGLDQTREALSRINNGKQVTVEAYGSLDGDRLFVIIALRGKVDIDKTVADSGATPDKIKKIGKSTCVESSGNLPTQCYRGSNTLTVIAQSANEGVNVDKVEPVAEEAFKAMR